MQKALEFDGFSVCNIEDIPFTGSWIDTSLDWSGWGRCLELSWPEYILNGNILSDYVSQVLPDYDFSQDAKCYQLGEALKAIGEEHPEALTPVGFQYWDGFPHYSIALYCISSLQPFSGLTVSIAEPVQMRAIRGVNVTCKFKDVPAGDFDWTIKGTLSYIPTFDATNAPPSYRGVGNPYNPQSRLNYAPYTDISLPKQWPPVSIVSLDDCYASGWYYPGSYDGIISLSAFRSPGGEYEYGGGRFMVKDMAVVGETGRIGG
jgi:hypothetical protein